MSAPYQDYLDEVDDRDHRQGVSEEDIRERRAMLEANGEEYPGAYAGSDGWGPFGDEDFS